MLEKIPFFPMQLYQLCQFNKKNRPKVIIKKKKETKKLNVKLKIPNEKTAMA